MRAPPRVRWSNDSSQHPGTARRVTDRVVELYRDRRVCRGKLLDRVSKQPRSPVDDKEANRVLVKSLDDRQNIGKLLARLSVLSLRSKGITPRRAEELEDEFRV